MQVCLETGDPSSIPGLGRSAGEGIGYPLQDFGLENSMDYSPWGHKELDMTERISLSLFLESAPVTACDAPHLFPDGIHLVQETTFQPPRDTLGFPYCYYASS